MGASKEKKLRKETGGDSVFAGNTGRDSSSAKHDRNAILFFVVGIVILVAFVVLVFFNSGILNKYVKAVDANGHKVTAAELSFYYNSQYNNFVTNYGDYLEYIGLDTSKDLDKQESTFAEGQTWAQYFMNSAISALTNTYLLYDEATAAGYTLTDADYATIEASLSFIEGSAASNGLSTNAYLRAAYGKGVNRKLFSKILESQYLSSNYYDAKMTEFTESVTEDDINAYYNENKDQYLNITYRSFLVKSGIDTEADDEATQVQKLSAAKAIAEEMAASIETEADFIDLAYANAAEDEKESYANDDYTLTTNTRYYLTTTVEGDDYTWLADTSRNAGDVTCVQVDNDYRVLMYLGEGRDTAYGAANVTIIVKNVENEDVAAARAEIDEVVALYEADPTEENFRSLVSYSDEQAIADGNYFNVQYGSLGVDEIDTWLFDDSRKIGDTQVIETDDAVFFVYVSMLEETWHASIRGSLASTAYNTWYSGISEGYMVTESTFGKNLVY